MGARFVEWDAWTVVAAATAWFAALYLLTGAVAWLLTEHVLPGLGIGRRLDPRPVTSAQLRRELRASSLSILVFGIGALIPWLLLRHGWARLAADPPWSQVAIEIGALFLWNELHFYLCHRLLHTRPLRRFHAEHHRSHVPTPWSTYAFHPVEAALLGSVPLLPMLAHDFGFASLLALTVLSIALNNLGHGNYEASRNAPARGWLGASRRHHLHHACYQGNYGFLLEVFDRMFGSVLPLDAADAAIARHGRGRQAPQDQDSPPVRESDAHKDR
ncbi:sterol desaturase family protein [Marilutibacter chinensis]|uniref:Sterol desaturase family protein n=1 Tax=Marilutibacter chinensis TaxID=2912247 RepID=A0ABS9HVP4_9GAMM|nr:sterol desaturase family protein [Lysobacter chinensis]MCF7222773.1 sterol desaturase family protein [Lysobacter chinensis]